jgi:exonuclease SbcD
MRIVQTGDWHLGARLNGLRRLDDQFAQIDRVLDLCDERAVDVLVVAGDVFETAETEELRDIIDRLWQRLRSRIQRGLSVLLIPGNHDGESVFPVFERVQRLAGTITGAGAHVVFSASPSTIARTGRDGQAVQFVLLPFPTPSVYLDDRPTPPTKSELHALLAQKWRDQSLERVRTAKPGIPIVVVSHILVRGSDIGSGYRLSEDNDVPIEPGDLPTVTYNAFAHVHKPQRIEGRRDAQYCGPLERMALDERNDPRGVILLDVRSDGLHGDPEFIALPACPFYEFEIDGQAGLATLVGQYPDRDRAYVYVTVNYEPGTDNPHALGDEVRRLFPRCVRVSVRAKGSPVARGALAGADRSDVAGTTRRFVADAIVDEAQRTRVLRLLDGLLREVRA